MPDTFTYGFHLAIMILCLPMAWFLPILYRCTPLALDWYYPQRSKARQLCLYKTLLAQRERIVVRFYKRLLWLKGNNMTGKYRSVPLWEQVRNYHSILDWLLSWYFKYMCSVCGEPEKGGGAGGLTECPNDDCPLLYCQSCWEVAEQQCIDCTMDLSKENLMRFMDKHGDVIA